MERFIYKGTKQLRCGYTTGSCAAGAAKAAAVMLLTGAPVGHTELLTPAGVLLKLEVCHQRVEKDFAKCAVVKDSGDDPDVTNGIEVFAEVSRQDEAGVAIVGGEGIGKVTKAGLDQPVGEYAINSVPRKMIAEALCDVAELYEYSGGFKVVISVPQGEEIAKKTFNPRMGIVGGISIIGTTGIVEPMSDYALIETIRTEANMRRSEGAEGLLLTVGNYSEQFVKMKHPGLDERCVMCSNFIGDAIDIGLTLGFERILIVGHIGKMVKLGAGIMNTHSSVGDGRIETLIACAALAGAERAVLSQLTTCVTADAALDILFDKGYGERTLDILIEKIEHYLRARAGGQAEIGAVVFSFKNDLLLKTNGADEILQRIAEEQNG